ncbi:MAG: ECF-type sigma factor [Vicinamibacteraceae bacterium]
MSHHEGITKALRSLLGEGADASDQLVPLVYNELRRLARRQRWARRPEQTLTTTGLVHEAYLKLAGQRASAWRDRDHFFATAARAMRHILIDHAKSRLRQKRGGGLARVTLDERHIASDDEAEQLLLIDDALERLAAQEARLAQVVECRFFAGMSEQETAAALGVSERTVQRDWARARSWLKEEIGRK